MDISNLDGVELSDNILVIKFNNIHFYNEILIDNSKLNNLNSDIQSYINLNDNKFTNDEFEKQINSDTFKKQIATNLSIDVSTIGTISFLNNKLVINPSSLQKFISSSLTNNIINGVIEINDLHFNFYKIINLVKLNSLYDSLNDYISQPKRLYTSTEFVDEAPNLNKLISENLKISNDENINIDEIKNISFDDKNNQLEITLNDSYKKYNLEYYKNASLEANKLIISNLEFYTSISVDNSKLNNLNSDIQSYINLNDNKFTNDEFEKQINSDTFKKQIATNLSIDVSTIGTISFLNNKLIISPSSMQKFVTSSTSDNIVDGMIEITNLSLKFYENINLVKLDVLRNAINRYISDSSRMYTVDEFRKNLSGINNTVQENLYVSEDDLIDSNLITNISLNDNNQLEIQLDSNYKKYTIPVSNGIAQISNSTLKIINLRFYNTISIDSTNLDNLKNNIQNFINENNIKTDNFANAFANNSWISGIQTSDKQELSTYVSSVPKIKGRQVEITLNTLYKFVDNLNTSNNNIELTQTNILINNINIETSNECFNWNTANNEIIGLSEKGLKQETVVFPNQTTSILNNVFIKNLNIKYIDMSLSNIISINSNNANDASGNTGLFYGASNLISCVLNSELQNISVNMFYGCSNLLSIEIPQKVTVISAASFRECYKLNSVIINGQITTIQDGAFRSCQSLKEIVLPNSLSSIGISSFQGCSSLTNINLPNNLNSIGESAIRECTSLETITIPDSINVIQKQTFNGCINLKTVNLPQTLSEIGGSAFYGCSNLVNIQIPSTVTSIKDNVFLGCSSLENIELPETITIIEAGLFSGCLKLSSIKIPGNVTSIGAGAFNNCRALTSIVIPNNVTTISEGAFAWCVNLNSITIPNSVTSIASDSFVQIYNNDINHKTNLLVYVYSEDKKQTLVSKDYFQGLPNENIIVQTTII